MPRILPALASVAALATVLAGNAPARAQAPADDLDARVERGLKFTSRTLDGLTRNTQLSFHWFQEGERVWYKREEADGTARFVAITAATGTKSDLFEPEAMARALRAAGAGVSADASDRTTGDPRIHDLHVAPDGRSLVVDVPLPDAECLWPQLYDVCSLPVQSFACDLPVTACRAQDAWPADLVMAPDRHRYIAVKDHDLWLHDLRGGAARRLTSDGEDGFAYGELHDQLETFAFSRRRAGLPEPVKGVLWSPDGRYVLALRHDVRPYPDRLILTEYVPPEGGLPVVHTKREADASDAVYPAAQLSVLSLAEGTQIVTDLDPHLMDDLANLGFNAGQVWWDTDHARAWLIGARRGGRDVRLLEVDLASGKVRTLVQDTGDFPQVLGPGLGPANVSVLPDQDRFIWYSERSGFGHLYLGELSSGRILRPLTKGDWVVTDLLHVDTRANRVFFAAAGREAGSDPYYRRLYSVPLSGGSPTLLTPAEADHAFAIAGPGGSVSPGGRYFIDDASTISQPDRYTLHSQDGAVIAEIDAADISALRAAGWSAPEKVTATASDGTTQLYGVIYKPADFDPAKRYPTVEITYPGIWAKYHPTTFRDQFYGSATLNAFAFANAGAVVVSLDGRGTSYRSAAFRNFVYGKDDATGAHDHAAALRELAASRPWIDLSRVGVTGHSSGGDGSLRAAMLYPDLYKVVVSGEGPSDYLTLPMDIAVERALGVPDTKEGLAYYRRIATPQLVDRLKPDQKVFLIYAGADEEVPLQQGFTLFQAFQDAGRLYDELIIPDAGHWGGRGDYGVMRTVRYFAENLGAPEPAPTPAAQP
ncbi:MAG: DPP IV N-terminal domain-containing protein [Pseudomonadota bacterium]|nr:DPP IV N-terminal domain-containing protein [Pseudomonadota bacterium]